MKKLWKFNFFSYLACTEAFMAFMAFNQFFRPCEAFHCWYHSNLVKFGAILTWNNFCHFFTEIDQCDVWCACMWLNLGLRCVIALFHLFVTFFMYIITYLLYFWSSLTEYFTLTFLKIRLPIFRRCATDRHFRPSIYNIVCRSDIIM